MMPSPCHRRALIATLVAAVLAVVSLAGPASAVEPPPREPDFVVTKSLPLEAAPTPTADQPAQPEQPAPPQAEEAEQADVIVLFPGFGEKCNGGWEMTALGLAWKPGYFDDFIQELVDGGRDRSTIVCIDWDQDLSLPDLMSWMARRMAQLQAQYPDGTTFTFVGHSAGALAMQVALATSGIHDQVIHLVSVNGATFGWPAPGAIRWWYGQGFQQWGGEIMGDEIRLMYERYAHIFDDMHLTMIQGGMDPWVLLYGPNMHSDFGSLANIHYGSNDVIFRADGTHHMIQNSDYIDEIADVVDPGR